MKIIVEKSTIERISELRNLKNAPELCLSVRVDGGGCSGFKYSLELTEDKNTDDLIFENCVITDTTSLPFIENSVISFEKGLIGSEFKIKNPNAASGCGCGISFSPL